MSEYYDQRMREFDRAQASYENEEMPSEEFERAFPTNAQRIQGMTDEELAKELTRNPPSPCRMCEYYDHKLSCCYAPNDFVCVTAYAEALTLDWLQQPAETEGTNK